MSNKARLEWIDVIKGFAIICMLISHAIPGYDNAVKNWITAFNMPLFFVVSGYLKAFRKREYGYHEIGLYLKKQFISLGVPYLLFCLLYTFFMLLLSLYSAGWTNDTLNQLFENLKNTFFFLGVQSMWFIPVYFYSLLINDFVIIHFASKWKSLLTIIMVSFLLIINYTIPLSTVIRMIGKVIGALIFLQLGDFAYRYKDTFKMTPVIMFFTLFSLIGMWNGFVSLNFEYGKVPLLFFVDAAVLSISLCYLVEKISYYLPDCVKELVSIYGKYSIAILVTNNIIIEIVRLLDYKLAGDIFLNNGNIGYFGFALLLVILEYPILLVARGKLGWIFGKTR